MLTAPYGLAVLYYISKWLSAVPKEREQSNRAYVKVSTGVRQLNMVDESNNDCKQHGS